MTHLQIIKGIDFRHMDERERMFYLADPDHAAYIHEDEAGAFVIVHDGETWRAQIDESSGDYITTVNLWCDSPTEAADEIFAAWREVINGEASRDIWQ